MPYSFNLITSVEDCDVIMAEANAKRASFDFKVNSLARQIEIADRNVEKLTASRSAAEGMHSIHNSLAENNPDPLRKKQLKQLANDFDNDRIAIDKTLLAYPEEKVPLLEHELTKAQAALAEMDVMIAGLVNRKTELQSAAAA